MRRRPSHRLPAKVALALLLAGCTVAGDVDVCADGDEVGANAGDYCDQVDYCSDNGPGYLEDAETADWLACCQQAFADVCDLN